MGLLLVGKGCREGPRMLEGVISWGRVYVGKFGTFLVVGIMGREWAGLMNLVR